MKTSAIWALWLLFLPAVSWGGMFFSLAGLYQDDTVAYRQTEGGGIQWGLLQVGSNFTWKIPVYFGVQYGQLTYSKIVPTAIIDRYTVTDMGPMISWFFPPKKPILQLAAGYNVSSNIVFERTGSQAQQASATSYWASAGAELEFAKGWFLGGKLVYYSLKPAKNWVITEQENTYSVSGGRTLVIPQFVISWRSL